MLWFNPLTKSIDPLTKSIRLRGNSASRPAWAWRGSVLSIDTKPPTPHRCAQSKLPVSGNLPLACYSLHSKGNQAVLFRPEEDNNKPGLILRHDVGVKNPHVLFGEMSRSLSGLCCKFVFGFSGKVFFFLLPALRS